MFTQQFEVFLSVLRTFGSQVLAFFPNFMAAIVILLLGWMCAKVVSYIVKRVLIFAKFDRFAERSGLEAYLKHDTYQLTLSGAISQVVYWLVILLFVITSAKVVGLTEVANMLYKLANYLPKMIVAILVFMFGTLLARFLNRLIFSWLHSIKFDNALVLSTSAEYCVQILALFIALEQLEIGTKLLTAIFIIIFGAVFLALAIAFGLGGKEWAAKQIELYQHKSKSR